MVWIALKMLMGDKGKYFAIIFGVSFACFLIAEQSATFCGIMLRTTSQIHDTQGVDIWVMNTGVRYVPRHSSCHPPVFVLRAVDATRGVNKLLRRF
jgi:hypothetical protein